MSGSEAVDRVGGGFHDRRHLRLQGPRPQALADIALDRRDADYFSAGVVDRRLAERNVQQTAVLVEPPGFILLNLFALQYSAHYLLELVAAIGRYQNSDRFAGYLGRRIAVQLLGPAIPGLNRIVGRLGDN